MRYKQSSDCEVSSLKLLLISAARPELSLAPLELLLDRSGMFWGQTGRNLFARSVSFQGATVTGGMNLRLPRGGVAKGMPRKVATGWRLSVGCWRTPCTGPYLVATFLKQRKPSEISGLRSTSRYTSASCWISEIKWIPSKDAWKLLAPSVLSCCLQKEKSELNYLSAFG